MSVAESIPCFDAGREERNPVLFSGLWSLVFVSSERIVYQRGRKESESMEQFLVLGKNIVLAWLCIC